MPIAKQIASQVTGSICYPFPFRMEDAAASLIAKAVSLIATDSWNSPLSSNSFAIAEHVSSAISSALALPSPYPVPLSSIPMLAYLDIGSLAFWAFGIPQRVDFKAFTAFQANDGDFVHWYPSLPDAMAREFDEFPDNDRDEDLTFGDAEFSHWYPSLPVFGDEMRHDPDEKT